MRTPTLALAITAFSFLAQSFPAQAFIRCSRDAEVRAVNPEPVTDKDPCTGTIIVQGLSYKCGVRAEVETLREQYLKDLSTKGEEACKEACSARSAPKGGKCVGVFTQPAQCGFSLPAESAEIYGRENAGCDPRCGGVAFAYCSIYHSVTLQIRPEKLKGAKPNCFCKVEL